MRWACDNGMEFAPSKCVLLKLGLAKRRPEWRVRADIDGVRLAVVHVCWSTWASSSNPTTPKLLYSAPAFEEVKAFVRPTFNAVRARYGCPLLLGRLVAASTFFPKLLYGNVLRPIDRERTRRVASKLCKVSLGGQSREGV